MWYLTIGGAELLPNLFHMEKRIMYNVSPMKKAFVISLFMIATFAWAAQPTSLALPPVAYADTEVVTNVVISSWQRGAAEFAFSLSCLATPSNNVEVAFGKDVSANGVLEPEETDLVVGWNRGAWFVQNGIDGERFTTASSSTEDVKTLAWTYRLTAASTPSRLAVTADDVGVFAALAEESPAWLHRKDCDLMRLTGRGLYNSGETFTVGTPLDPTAILFR